MCIVYARRDFACQANWVWVWRTYEKKKKKSKFPCSFELYRILCCRRGRRVGVIKSVLAASHSTPQHLSQWQWPMANARARTNEYVSWQDDSTRSIDRSIAKCIGPFIGPGETGIPLNYNNEKREIYQKWMRIDCKRPARLAADWRRRAQYSIVFVRRWWWRWIECHLKVSILGWMASATTTTTTALTMRALSTETQSQSRISLIGFLYLPKRKNL